MFEGEGLPLMESEERVGGFLTLKSRHLLVNGCADEAARPIKSRLDVGGTSFDTDLHARCVKAGSGRRREDLGYSSSRRPNPAERDGASEHRRQLLID